MWPPRRPCLFLLLLTILGQMAPTGWATDLSSPHFTLEVRNRQLTGTEAALRVQRDDVVTLHWRTDEPISLHLHGYDLEIVVNPESSTTVRFKADQVGRFAVMAHRFGTHPPGSHAAAPLAYLEVRPHPEDLRLPAQPDTKSSLPPLSPDQSANLLETLAVVSQEQQATDIDISSSVLCFCLTKGPETIRELRRAAEEWFAKGLRAFQDRRYEEAITAFTKTIQLHPRHARAYLNRGIAFGNLHHYQAARADFNNAVNLEPQQPGAYYAAAVMSRLLGDAQQAQRDLQAAAQLGYEPARLLLGGKATP